MAEETGQEKTEQPTSKRLREAREKGQVARSKDLNATIILMASGMAFIFFGQYLASGLATIMIEAFSFSINHLTNPDSVGVLLIKLIKLALFGLLPIFFAVLLASLFGPISLGGWSFSSKGFLPQFSRLNPLKGFKRMVSVKGFVEMVKSLAKFLVVAVFGIYIITKQLPDILALSNFPLDIALSKAVWILSWSFLAISSTLILISLIDVPFQLHQHNKQLKMTKQEVKDEYKETEGKPEVKSHQRRVQQEIAQQRMMHEVPKADVILTNPTHYSVAISYEDGGNTAPRVIAKGKDMIALQINKIGQFNEVPLLQIPPLARAVFFSTKLNHEIPRGLYIAVAQVLAYIFQLRKTNKPFKGDVPNTLSDLPIPKEYQRD